jgi:hypothetical protein
VTGAHRVVAVGLRISAIGVCVLIAITGASACVEPREAFVCTSASQCKSGAGTCEPTGFCSFDDATCPSGRRYGEHAGRDLASQCVVNPNGSFDVVSASSASYTSMTVTFGAPPEPEQAVVLSNYAVDGLTLSGTPTLSGSTVTIETSVQAEMPYTVTVSGVTRASDAAPLWMRSATFTGRDAFRVVGAVSTTNRSVRITFSAPPEPASAVLLAHYAIPGLTLSGTPVISGNTVTLETSPQSEILYTVTVTGVRRASDTEALVETTADFTGRIDFNVLSAVSLSSGSVAVTFDAPPDPAKATVLSNYAIGGLTLTGTPVLTDSTVTLVTSTQVATTYAITVSGVTRAADQEPLTVASANFSGITTFNVAGAMPATSGSVVITFDGAPNPTEATNLASYTIPGLTLGGTPALAGNTVTLQTSPQSAISYTAMVSGVTRASDGEPLTQSSATFTGRAPFNVTSAEAISSTSVRVTFDGAPNPSQATMLASYAIPGLTLSGTPSLSGNQVTLTTSPQAAAPYTVTVSGVTRAADGEVLTQAAASFTGRAPFNVTGATSLSNTSIRVTFDAAPNASQATTLANYAIPGLTLSGTPVLTGSQVTLTTSSQAAMTYAVQVTGVTRAFDAEALTVASASFAGRLAFNVAGAASASNVAITVTFDAPPNSAQATNLTNYSVPGLTLSGTPSLSGNTVTITTSSQIVTTYTVTVSGVTRASDGEALATAAASFTGKTGFNVASATSVNSFAMSVTFDAAPDPTQATTVGNYSVPGLTLSSPVLSGNTVTLATSAQAGQTYTVTVNNVTRASDSSPLAVNTASFAHTTFNVTSAASITSHLISVTFDAPPNPAQATSLGNYSIPGLLLSGTPELSGNTVTIATSAQSAVAYTVNVANVTRQSDGSVLTMASATFTGRPEFNVESAASTSSGTMTVTFSHAPNAAQAAVLGNYSVPGLTLSGTPVLAGNTVSLTTSAQAATTYTVTVANVARASDAEPLTITNASFAGTPLQTPTVTNVAVLATSPNNGTTFYNTGTATVRITGTHFTGVACPTGVRLDDLDGAGSLVATPATTCTVDSGTQITATFPAGVRTNGTSGWNVRVTNAVGTNATSAVRLVVRAGLLISEVYTGSSGPNNATREFIEVYNPTATQLNVSTLGLRLHIRSAAGANTNLPLTYLFTVIPSHGHMLLVSTDSKQQDPWYGKRDATYNASTAQLIDNGGVYLSLSATANALVLDKAGWGTQPAPGFEGTAHANIPLDSSAQRKPAGGQGAATDTDVNASDFLAPSTVITPRGSLDPPQP